MVQAQKGSIAFSSDGHRGLITSIQPELVIDKDGVEALAWTGYHIGPALIGKSWSSPKPRVVQNTKSGQYQMIMGMLRRVQLLKDIPMLTMEASVAL